MTDHSQVYLRIFDVLVNEGTKILYRVGLALLKINMPRLLVTSDKESFLNTLNTHTCNDSDVTTIMKVAFGLYLSREKHLRTSHSFMSNTPESPRQADSVYYVPNIDGHSNIVKDYNLYTTIWSWLPSRLRIVDGMILFSSNEHGYNNRTLYHKSQGRERMILLVKTRQGAIFGAFLSGAFQIGEAHHGTGESFLFTLAQVGKDGVHVAPHKFPWTRKNNMFVHFSPDHTLSIGGSVGATGGIGLRLDQELVTGSSARCDTFDNHPLHLPASLPEEEATETNFAASQIELLSFKE